ncbi:MAG TPA: LysE family translocator [Solirubrobacteraceae bacterium]|nr:LysE family translocator [Solirubrobacteraceae bacterium]
MFQRLLTFVPVAALLSITPGAATALVVRNAARGGRRHAFFTTSGNSIGVLAWGCFAAVGVATLVATSAAVFDAVKLAGAVVLIVIGLRSLRSREEPDADATEAGAAAALSGRAAVREGLITSLANPKLAVFFVALFPQFIPRGAPVLPSALAMAGVIVAVDLIWYSTLALLVARARRAFVAGGWGRRVERLTGAVLIGLGIRLALERR